MRRTLIVLATAAGLGLAGLTGLAFASEGETQMQHESWSFNGPLGRFDQAQLQRGYKVYREVCSSCHSMNLLSFRNLGEKGGPFFDPETPNANENPIVKQIASEYEVDTINTETGDTEPRPAIPADRFHSPFKNEYLARAGNGGALPPDLSVIIKARAGGADYVYSVLMGYGHPVPSDMDMPQNMHYNVAFPGNKIAMKPPLEKGKVTFDDGKPSTVDQMARDVVTFLAWASEPKQTERKEVGLVVLALLLLIAGLAYGSYRTVWKNQAH